MARLSTGVQHFFTCTVQHTDAHAKQCTSVTHCSLFKNKMKLPIVLYVVSKKEILLFALIMSTNSLGMFMEDRTTASTGICFMFAV